MPTWISSPQYFLAGVTDHQKSELLKDILAMANAYRAVPGDILIGFKDRTPQPAEVAAERPRTLSRRHAASHSTPAIGAACTRNSVVISEKTDRALRGIGNLRRGNRV